VGEVLGLRWKDIDGATVKLKRQLHRRTKDKVTGESRLDTALPKSGHERTFEMAAETVGLLREHKRVQSEIKLKNRLHYADHDLVFAQQWEQLGSRHATLGWPLNRTSVRTKLRKLCTTAKVKQITFHGLRHTTATVMAERGVPINVVSKRLGHSRISMTLDTYTHVSPGKQAEAAEILSTALQG
jgi:integrase